MEETVIFEQLASIISRYCKTQGAIKFDKQLRFIEDLGVNSARLVDIVLDIEDKFNIEIDDESADKINTLGDAIALIQARLQATVA